MAEIYHATWPSKVSDILEEGLKPGIDGCVYLAGPLPAHAATFVAIRGGEFDGMEEVEVDGKMEKFPKMIQHDTIFVFSVDTNDLDPELLHESTDHSQPSFRRARSRGTMTGQYIQMIYNLLGKSPWLV